jgi:RNA polymerase sigma-70 factor (ECF subfamily)
MSDTDEKTLLKRFQEGDRGAFSFLFTRYYADLVNFARAFTKDVDAAEEIIQDIFTKLWGNRHSLTINSSLKSFLLRWVQNRCIDWVRHMDIHDSYRNTLLSAPLLVENDTDHYVLYSELQVKLNDALRQMPDEISDAFRMNRFEGMTYREIADRQGISVRSVEVRIGKALQFLREKLKEFLVPVFLLLGWLGLA